MEITKPLHLLTELCFSSLTTTLKKHKLKVVPVTKCISMASSSLTSPVKGHCMVDINLLGKWYSNMQSFVLPNLCSDVILGQDFRSQNSTVSIAFGGPKKALHSSDPTICSVPSASVDMPHLFSSLAPRCKPKATKSRKFEDDNKKFIQSEVDKMLQEGITEESTSPGRHKFLSW